jgi:hypothetical protein
MGGDGMSAALVVEVGARSVREIFNYAGETMVCSAGETIPSEGEWVPVANERTQRVFARGQVIQVFFGGGFVLANFKPA